ncbi:MAG: 7-carboxy-7-deazaguanine synthase QueE [Gammaproteobacteria bacterium]|nr:MAG: 7-carboxy-7-deazaguanine synthase QueE [Gammaproteobacteria bacterium]
MTQPNLNSHIPLTPMVDCQQTLRLTEIFYSLQGEALASGQPTIFIRLTGCPLRCVYCDTTYSFKGGERWSLQQILVHIKQYPCKRVCITGGEPMAQKNVIALMQLLLDNGYEISLETAGALSLADVPKPVSKVMDLKTPSSGETAKNHWQNLNYLTQHDQIKLVICNLSDYKWAKQKVIEHDLTNKVAAVWFSPMFNIHSNQVEHQSDINTTKQTKNHINHTPSPVPNLATNLAEWILADGIDVRLQLQLHKIIWADAKGK